MKRIKKTTFIILLALIFGLSFNSCKTIEKKKDPNFLGDFEDQTIATLMTGNVKIFKKELKPINISFIFSPRRNTVTFYFKNRGRSLDNIVLTLNQNNREIISNGIKTFLDAYNNTTLKSEDNNKKSFFGKTQASMAWGVLGPSRIATPKLRCEFQLLTDNRPFFILASSMAKGSDGANSPSLRIAFSPAQCEDLLKILNQENLLKIVNKLQEQFNKYESSEKKEKNEKETEKKEENAINYN